MTTYVWGRSGRMRAYQDYLGLSVDDMADKLDIARRSYQRMVRGQAAIPESMWEYLDSIVEEHGKAVSSLLTEAREYHKTAGKPFEFVITNDAWVRSVFAHAAMKSEGLIVPMTQDDVVAAMEMRDE